MVEDVIRMRRICWPNPDATCLHGGCIYCNGHPFRTVVSIRDWAERAGTLPHRGRGERDAYSAFLYGLENEFFNADTK